MKWLRKKGGSTEQQELNEEETLLKGLPKYIAKLEQIQRDIDGEERDDQAQEKGDAFTIKKSMVYADLEEVRRMIKERAALQARKGSNREVIERGVRIRELIASLDKEVEELKALQRKRKSAKLSMEEYE